MKLSGEAFANTVSQVGLCDQQLSNIAEQVLRAAEKNVQIGLVVGGGNFMRGAASSSSLINRTSADQIGMLATLINAIALSDALEAIAKKNNNKIKIKIYSAVEIAGVVPRFNAKLAIADQEAGTVIIYAAGTGNPFCTTDSAAALRAIETNADVIIKATKVDGIYNKDPKKYADAVRYEHLSFNQALAQELQVMDLGAFALCRDFNLPISVIDLYKQDGIFEALMGLSMGTVVSK